MAGNNRTSVVLQERDLRLFEALQSMRVVDREQAKVVAGFGSTRRANDRLLTLTKAGFLKRAFVGSRHAVYWLASTALQERGREARRRRSRSQPHSSSITNWKSTACICWCSTAAFPFPAGGSCVGRAFRLRSLKQCRSSRMDISSSVRRRESAQALSRWTSVLKQLGCLPRKPDSTLSLATSGEFPKILGRSQFRVLVITTSERRLQNIREAIAKLSDKIFWFSTLDAVSRERFWSPVWLRPTGDQLQPLL